jgi:hypothetical protein
MYVLKLQTVKNIVVISPRPSALNSMIETTIFGLLIRRDIDVALAASWLT